MAMSFARLCWWLSIAARGLFWMGCLGLVILAAMLVFGWAPELWAPGLIEPDADLTTWQRAAIWGLGLGVATPGLVALSSMAGLFDAFARGEVFTAYAARAIRRIGLMLGLGAILTIVAGAVRSVVVTVTNPPGERMLAISLGSQEMLLILLGGLLVVIGQAMAEAARMDAEMKAII